MTPRFAAVAFVFIQSGDAFLHGFIRHRSTPRLSAEEPKTIVLSEIESPDKEVTAPAWIKHQDDQKGVRQEGISATNYTSFIDAEGFDGGDGQVGTVGSKDSFMPKFKNKETVDTGGSARSKVAGEAVGGSESKKKQVISFGYTTGYAEKLKESGMTSIDEYGDDKLFARRQQLENWQNQQAHKARQTSAREEFSRETGTVYDSRRATESYFKAIEKGEQSDDHEYTILGNNKKKEVASEAASGLVKGAITEVVEMSSSFPRPSFHELSVVNEALSYDEFVVGFAPGSSDEDFQARAPLHPSSHFENFES